MALGDSSFPTHVALFQQALSEGKVVMASDGSLQGSNDETQGWKLLCRQDNTSACGHGVVQSGGNEMSPLRAEIGGFLGGLVAVDTRAGARITAISQRMPLFKLEFDLFATMKQRRRYEKQNDGQCPRCVSGSRKG